MCGLVGIFTQHAANNAQLSLLANMLYVDHVRGNHATGIARVNPVTNKVDIHKRAKGALTFLNEDATKEFLDKDRARIYMGHNRYATQGDKTKDEFAHPFQHKHITLVHNGGVDSWVQHKLDGYTDPAVVVDSHMVCVTIAERGVKEAVKLLSGAFALIWWDANERSLNFLRNDKRPLHLATTNDGMLVWASEEWMFDTFIAHKSYPSTYKGKPFELPVNEHWKYQFSETGALQNGGAPVTEDMVFTQVADPNPPARWEWEGYGVQGNRGSQRQSARNYASYDEQKNQLLAKWKIDAKINDRIVIEVDRIAQSSVGYVNVYGYYDGDIPCIMYSVQQAMVDGAKRLEATLSNIIEESVTIGAGNVKKVPKLTLSGQNATRVFGPKATVSKLEHFPLQTNGYEFKNRLEFNNFVKRGCTLCGESPSCYSQHAHLMLVWNINGTVVGDVDECDFICGTCMANEELKPNDNAK